MKKYSQGKKLISFTLAFALLISLFSILPLSATAAGQRTVEKDGFTFTEVSAGNKFKLASYSGSATEIVIPGEVECEGSTYPVTSFAATVFSGNTNITSVEIPGSITTLTMDGFNNCSNLKTVTLNEGLKTIYSAFMGTAVKEITVPESVTKLTSAFVSCSSIEKVSFLGNLDIPVSTFAFCTGLKDIYFYGMNNTFCTKTTGTTAGTPNIFKEVPDYKNITIHAYKGSVAYDWATENQFTNIDELKIDKSQLEKAVSDAKAKSEIMYTADSYKPLAEAIKNAEDILKQDSPSASDILNSIKAINEAISNLVEDNTTSDGFIWQTINEGKEIEIIGVKERAGDELTIPSEIKNLPVTSIGSNSLKNLNYINIIIPDSVKIIKTKAFDGGRLIGKITFGENSQLETIEDFAFDATGSNGTDNMNEISLPASLKSIGGKAFAGRQNLLMATVNSKDVEFANNVFEGSVKLTLIGYKNSTSETYAKENGYKFRYLDLDTTELKELYDQAKELESRLYTPESYAALSDAMDAAKKMLSNQNATPDEVEECKKTLQAAIDGLVLVGGGSETTAPETTVLAETTVAPETTAPDVTEATTVAAETTAPAGGTIEVLLGDADGSGKVDVKDVTHIQKHIAAYFTLEGANALAADVDGSGVIDVNDVTYVQKYLAAYKVDYKIGEVVQFGSDTPAPTEEMPQPTDEQPTTSAQDPTTAEPEPTTAEPEPTVPENSTRFYIPNYVSWLNNDGCKLWLYNDDTDGLLAATEYEENPDGVAGYFYFDLPKEWDNLSIYRTAYEVTEKTFDKNSLWDEASKTGIILNKWEHIGSKGDYNAYKVTADGQGFYYTFDPNEKKPDENERTIYFDNSKTGWATVYVYGWSYGLNQEWAPMEFEGNDIWSYTFYDDLPVDGVTGFLFVNQSGGWDGARQTADMATEAGKNLFVPDKAGNAGEKITGTWDVYNP